VDVRIGEVRVWVGKGTNSTEKTFSRKKHRKKRQTRLLTGSSRQASKDSNNEANVVGTQLKEPLR
jgi:hypothetical protein